MINNLSKKWKPTTNTMIFRFSLNFIEKPSSKAENNIVNQPVGKYLILDTYIRTGVAEPLWYWLGSIRGLNKMCYPKRDQYYLFSFGITHKKENWVGIGHMPVPTWFRNTCTSVCIMVCWLDRFLDGISRQGLEKGRFNGHVQHENLSSLTSRQRSGQQQQRQDHNFRF